MPLPFLALPALAATAPAAAAAAGGGFSLGTALSLGATGLSALGSLSQGRAAASEGLAGQAQAESIARLSEFEAAILRQMAKQERDIAEIEEDDFRRAQRRLLARKRAEAGASGIDLTTGSPLLAVGDFAAEAELQARRLRSKGDIRGTRFEQQAALSEFEAEVGRAAGTNLAAAGRSAQDRGLFRAGSSLLRGFATAFG